MSTKNKFSGWWIAFASFIMMGTIYTYNNLVGLFIKPLQLGLHASRSQVSLVVAIATLIFMFTAPFVGKIMKKIGLQSMMTIGVILSGISYLGYSISTNLYIFYLFGAISGLGMALCTIIPVNVMLQNWFEEKNGLISGLVFMGTGIGGAIFTQIINGLMKTHDYKFVYLVMGIVGIMINLPFTLFIFKVHPAGIGQSAYGSKPTPSHTEKPLLSGRTLKEIRKKPEFLALLATVFILSFINICVMTQYPAHMGDNGYNLKFVSLIQTIYLLLLIFAKIIMGSLFDHIGGVLTFTIGSLAYTAVAFILLSMVKLPSAMYAFAVVMPVGASLVLLAPPLLTRTFFGRKDYGNIFGIVTFANMLGTAFGSPIISGIYDATGSYNFAWIILMVLSLLMPVLLIFANSRIKNYTEEKPSSLNKAKAL